MITALTGRRYRSFRDAFVLPLRPLTLVYGPNSAGKSALLRALPLLRAAVEGRGGVWPVGAPVLGGAEATDVAWNGGISITLGFSADALSYAWDWKGDGRAALPALDRLRMGGLLVEDALDDDPLTHRLVGSEPLRRFALRGALPDLSNQPGDPLAEQTETVRRLLEGVCWIPGRREALARRGAYKATDRHPAVWGTDMAAQTLIAARRRTDRSLEEEVGRFFLSQKLHLNLDLREDGWQLRLARLGGSYAVALADHGEGMSHVLAPLVAAALAARRQGPRLWCIEQPELHLHTDAEKALADRLCAAVSGPDPFTLLVETHSPTLLLAIRLAVAEGLLPADRVSLLWVEQDEEGVSHLRPADLDHLGRPGADWPRSAFGDEVALSRRLLARELARR